ncbi:BgTH12-00338 [Blumeria graminis f. sp. triticale]|uniref:BgTH12-00338 n=1 Tax=Blumeria graminis f. sp. triticale TaxID=1689686 RepID=A0A9W4DQY8_BLUGR|nr:BgTH12-00338 [Blumeria graminis f. sp. triticale]
MLFRISYLFPLTQLAICVSALSWNFDEAIISITGKAGSRQAFKDKLSDHVPLAKPVLLGETDTLKIIFTATSDGIAKRPHQAFLLLRDQDTGVETAFVSSFKGNGRGKVEFSQKDIPSPLLQSSQPLRATFLLGSFGESQAFRNHVFNLIVLTDQGSSTKYEKPLRYGRRDEINHTFRPDPKSGPIFLSAFFTLAIVATVHILFASWIYFGANLSHLPSSLKIAPLSHTLFYGSILMIEALFFFYYYKWKLFQLLPSVAILGFIACLSGPKALSEVQGRRLAGER